MDFDPKCFFENPPRMKEDLKEYIKDLSNRFLLKIIKYYNNLFSTERLIFKHIKYIMIAMSPDPLTCYNRHGLCVQNIKLKPIHRVLCKSIDTAMKESENGTKNGGLEKKILKSCAEKLKSVNIKFSPNGVIAISAVISTLCTILLQGSIKSDVKTLTLDMIKSNGVIHKSSSGASYPYSSLMRFIYIIENFEPYAVCISKNKEDKKDKIAKKSKNIVAKEVSSICDGTNKGVQFYQRPSTPDNCFWEE